MASNNDQGVDANVDQHSFNQVGDSVTEDSDIPIENSSSDAESDLSGNEHDNGRVNSDELAPQLAEWAIQRYIPHNALSALLSILRESHPDLPADARTLLGTSSSSHYQGSIKELSGGSYYHFGIAAGVKLCLAQIADLEPLDSATHTRSFQIKFELDCDVELQRGRDGGHSLALRLRGHRGFEGVRLPRLRSDGFAQVRERAPQLVRGQQTEPHGDHHDRVSLHSREEQGQGVEIHDEIPQGTVVQGRKGVHC